jgi:GH15 family glucan-1,4-alpha-glucosidase
MLLMPLVRFVSAKDPRWLATLDAIEKNLVRDGMVYRYHNDDNPIDGLPGTEGAFAACSFWYVECLARAGAWKRPIWNSNSCCATPTRWGCTRKNSTARRGTWATRRKR